MKIAVITPGRSHLLDMSKQFLNNGIDVDFYTVVPKSRCESFGLPRNNVISFFYILAPLMFLFRTFKFPKDINRYIYYLVCRMVDLLSSLYLKPCDIIISISGCSTIAVKKAKKKYGALFFCDRGAKHILEQDKILKTVPNCKQVFKKDIQIELTQYEMADRIILPSTHTYESFIAYGFEPNKLFINPYGVSLEMFYPIKEITPKYDIIFVGNWSMQKGVDLLSEAIINLKITLLHVGNISDATFPKRKEFTHIAPVDQKELVSYYNQARILVLPSRQDGFGLVLFQAMACGLPLVYTHNTGGPDLKRLISEKDYLIESKSEKVEDIMNAISKALNVYVKKDRRLYLTEEDKHKISWEGYGERYIDYIRQLCK